MMSIENPEARNEIVCVAPTEGQRPLSVMSDSNFEDMSNPDKFPINDGCFATERPNKLTYRKYFNKKLLDIDEDFPKTLTTFLLPSILLKSWR